MAQTYRKSKVEKLQQYIQSHLEITKDLYEKQKTDKSMSNYLEGQISAFETMLDKIEQEFDLRSDK